MPKNPGNYFRPENITEALRYLAQPDTVPLGGGTKLLATEAGVDHAGVVDLQAVGLDRVEKKADRLQIGAMVTLSGLAQTLLKEESAAAGTPFLLKALHQAGPNTYRNAATIGGTIASRLADSELLAALLLLNAEITLLNPNVQTLNLGDYLQDEDAPHGLISEISILWTAGVGLSERVARTPADYPIVSISFWQSHSDRPHLAATGLGPRPFRLTAAESFLQGKIDQAAIDAAAEAAAKANSHPGDFRGDVAYRADMAEVLTRRVLRQL